MKLIPITEGTTIAATGTCEVFATSEMLLFWRGKLVGDIKSVVEVLLEAASRVEVNECNSSVGDTLKALELSTVIVEEKLLCHSPPRYVYPDNTILLLANMHTGKRGIQEFGYI